MVYGFQFMVYGFDSNRDGLEEPEAGLSVCVETAALGIDMATDNAGEGSGACTWLAQRRTRRGRHQAKTQVAKPSTLNPEP